MTDQQEYDREERRNRGTTRAQFLKGSIAAGLAVAGGGSVLGGLGDVAAAAAATQTLRNGGSMTIGLGSGGTQDTLDPHLSYSTADAARQFALYDSLTQLRGSLHQLAPTNNLAEELVPNKAADVWTIRLKKGVEFHNGKTLDIDDFIYTVQRITNPKTGAFNIGRFILFDMAHAKKLDKLTLRVPLIKPVAIIPEMMGGGSLANIVPVGFDVKHPVGTGPFKLKSFTPGQQTVLERFPNYWGDKAHVDTLTFVALPDDTARYNALLSGQIDVLDSVPLAQLKTLQANSSYHVSSLPSSQWYPIYMRVDLAPFNDVRVRQAMRLCVDRKQIVETAYLGNAAVGNDLFGHFDPLLDTSLVREQDLPQAKSLLKKAGKQGVAVTLTTANIGPGALASCQVLAQNAQAAGFNLQLRQVDPGTMYGPNYLSWPFGIDQWPGITYLVLITTNDGPKAHVDLTHFQNAKFNSLFEQAIGQLDVNKRKDIAHELQRIEFTTGGNIVPAFPNYTAAYSTKVGGFYPANLTGGAVAAGFFNKLGFVA